MGFELVSEYLPTGDQPEAIEQLVNGLNKGEKYQILMGATGTGKTFTMANVIASVERPTLIISHNKTLAAQLYQEFKRYFPNNLVEYFVSYYDYYQPEAFIPSTNTYIEKDLSINEEIEKLRLATTAALMSGRRDVIVVASVSCIYGLGNPNDFLANSFNIKVGQHLSSKQLIEKLVNAMYHREDIELKIGTFRLKGDTLEIMQGYGEIIYRVLFFDDEIEKIESYSGIDYSLLSTPYEVTIYPASIFMTTKEKLFHAIDRITLDLGEQLDFLRKNNKFEEAQRLEDRVVNDLEMMKELGYCSGIENYSRYFDDRKPGERPFCLIDYFPQDYLMIIDESHVTIPQIRGMYGGDRTRKEILVEYGFRLPSAMDNRPLTFDEFESLINQVIYVSATPGDFEFLKTEGVFAEQIIRPTGIPDPEVFVRPTNNQIDDMLNEIQKVREHEGRVLVTTLTKKMAEELTSYLTDLNIPTRYIHSDVETLDRVEILRSLRAGDYDVLVGVNLLREGLDLPEVELVVILDADKEGFLRNYRSLIQTAGRAARNVNSRVILYADRITESMHKMLEETNRRREKQIQYNLEHNIIPTTVKKDISDSLIYNDYKDPNSGIVKIYYVADSQTLYYGEKELNDKIKSIEKEMKQAAEELDFVKAAYLRDQLAQLKKLAKL
ncbi:MAG TPA: excinuclease ABC subunit UvrB [Bacteroidales bacterium]|nr:excinuclease ABC subunit UvrB [Bacteroidales bacterium]HPU46130.1 excinuclease ABC subunit UvrB [Bacteroidales bacterium]HPZ35825.1 excinuclease ABC subunit UvrB [Bacteroidales bacterium]HXK90572.1 excinuclease ABC subunit UvrB [Bacteroidales bacterium]